LSVVDVQDLLRAVLPRLGLRWRGFRNVQGQVCKRIRRRIEELGLPDVSTYQLRLAAEPEEWHVLEQLCAVTISRFYRDSDMWQLLAQQALPSAARAALAAGDTAFRCWSAGCASGEEPYTLSLVWAFEFAERYPTLPLRVLATDVGRAVLARARAARYARATLRELPLTWQERAFEPVRELSPTRALQRELQLREPLRAAVELRSADLRRDLPEETFRLILCRNVAFTYFDERQHSQVLERLLTRLLPRGLLVIGKGEQLPTLPGRAALESLGCGVFRLRG
jgi:chemotaxis protein methyltransferase CheR